MIKNMLQAAIKMLEPDKSTPELATFKARVECAKVILEEIVSGMEEEKVAPSSIPPPSSSSPLPMPLRRPPGSLQESPDTNKDYEVIVNDTTRVLEGIKGLEPEANVIMDGKVVKLKDAIGKNFITISLP